MVHTSFCGRNISESKNDVYDMDSQNQNSSLCLLTPCLLHFPSHKAHKGHQILLDATECFSESAYIQSRTKVGAREERQLFNEFKSEPKELVMFRYG